MLQRPVVIGLSPNASLKDAFAALRLFLQPWKWRKGAAVVAVEQWFQDYFQVDTAISFNAGRSALYALLKALSVPVGNEVLVQAFTCVAVPNSVIWAGLKPIYVDIDASLNLDVADAEKKLTSKTKVLIVQHTFGVPADMDKIMAFCKKHNLILIEDCAHALGATYKGELVGTFGDGAIFSFGRDKIVSGVFGGMAIVNKQSKIDIAALQQIHDTSPDASFAWIAQQLFHPLAAAIVLPLYNFLHIGKVLLVVLQKLQLISFPVYSIEKKSKRPAIFPQKLPNALAALVLGQLAQVDQFNRHRREVAEMYFEAFKNKLVLPQKDAGAVYLRFNVRLKNRDMVKFQAKKQQLVLGNWYSQVIDPKGVDMGAIGYEWGSCVKAQSAAHDSLNLPTYPYLEKSQVKKIIAFFNQQFQHQ